MHPFTSQPPAALIYTVPLAPAAMFACAGGQAAALDLFYSSTHSSWNKDSQDKQKSQRRHDLTAAGVRTVRTSKESEAPGSASYDFVTHFTSLHIRLFTVTLSFTLQSENQKELHAWLAAMGASDMS